MYSSEARREGKLDWVHLTEGGEPRRGEGKTDWGEVDDGGEIGLAPLERRGGEPRGAGGEER